MSESARMWMEVTFNVAYLIVVWWLVVLMFTRIERVAPAQRRLARLFAWAFLLLALGDTGHVGFRVLAYALGDLETPVRMLGPNTTLVGLGALSTAFTVTLFYVLVLLAWAERFERPLGVIGWVLLLAAAARLVLMVPAANQWGSAVPPQPWSLVRNLPLMVQGLGVAALILWDAARTRDRLFTWVGVSILASYAFYLPVILFVQRAPLVGMLMIPKTLAYVAIALLAYRGLYRGEGAARTARRPA